MKKLISKTFALLAIAGTILSFSPKPGGEGFEIYLGDKLLTQQFGSKVSETKSFQLTQASSSELLIVKYYHCGRAGKNRVITIKDDQNKVVKEFHFKDAAVPVQSIGVPVKDLLGLRKGNVSFSMFYSSDELPAGRMLAHLDMMPGSTARL